MILNGYRDKHEYVNHNGTKSVLYLMDCMEAMSQISDKFFNLCISDPPYGINADIKNSVKKLQSKKSSALSKNYGIIFAI